MGNDSFHVYNGTTQEIPNVNNIKDHVFGNLRREFAYLCYAHYNAAFDEIIWNYVPEGETTPTLYVLYSIKDGAWAVGSLARVSATNFDHGETRPIMGASNGHLYQHEDGYDADGSAIEAYMELAPYALEDGRQILDVDGFVADFPDQVGNVTIEFEGFDRLRQAAIDSATLTVSTTEDLEDLRLCARHIGFTIRSNTVGGFFRYGKPMALVKSNGARR